MYDPTPEPFYEQELKPVQHDRLAIAIGNASLLGVGYLLLTAEWGVDSTRAVLVVCIGERASGAPIRTCPYRSETDGKVRNVTFRKMAFPVKAYELRTGKVVIDTRVEIGGEVCPATLTSFGPSDTMRMLASPAESDVRAAFAPIFTS